MGQHTNCLLPLLEHRGDSLVLLASPPRMRLAAPPCRPCLPLNCVVSPVLLAAAEPPCRPRLPLAVSSSISAEVKRLSSSFILLVKRGGCPSCSLSATDLLLVHGGRACPHPPTWHAAAGHRAPPLLQEPSLSWPLRGRSTHRLLL